jgi:hypothetical protein
VYLAALVTNLVFSYAEGQKTCKELRKFNDNENIVFQGSAVFPGGYLAADLFTSFWSSIGSSIQYLRLRLFFFWFFFSFSFSFGHLNYWTVFTIGLCGNFLLVLCFYWLVVYIEVYWILGIGNSFSKFCTVGLFPKSGTWTFLGYYSLLCCIHVECLLRLKCTDL